MRVLCLHGQGANSQIFKAQTKALRETLSTDYEFHFFDGQYECEPAPEVREHYPPPYLTWYDTPSTGKVLDAHRQLQRIIAAHGPFEAVMGFSQGAAVAASLLLHQTLEEQAPAFRAAIFIGSPLPFSYCTENGIDARTYFGVPTDPPNSHGRPTVIPPYLISESAHQNRPSDQQTDTLPRVNYSMFHATVDKTRINVPTGHVLGKADKWYRHSKDLVDLCQPENRSMFEHDGGHEIPRLYTDEICDLIETVFLRIAE